MRGSGVVIALALLVTGSALAADPACPWTWVNPTPPRVPLHRLIYAHGQLVAVGAGGAIITSPYGEQWTPRESGTDADLHGVEWAAGLYVAAGEGIVLTSVNGRDWSEAYRDDAVTFWEVEYGNGDFLVVGSAPHGVLLRSDDGSVWTAEQGLWDRGLHGIAWADGRFFACSEATIYSSEDGLGWDFVGVVPYAPPKQGFLDFDRFDLAWDGERLIWIGGAEAWLSEDGAEWSFAQAVDGCPEFSRFLGIYASATQIVLSGVGACPTPFLDPEARFYRSRDGGQSWLDEWFDFAGGFPGLALRQTTVWAVGDGGDVLSSRSFSPWTCAGGGCTSSACADGYADVIATDTNLIAVGGVGQCDDSKRLGGGTVVTSLDGEEWSITPVPTYPFRGIARGDSGFVAVGEGWVGTSLTGWDWQTQQAPTPFAINAVDYGGGLFIAAGVDGFMMASASGSSWDGRWSGTEEHLRDVLWDGAAWMVVGDGGIVLWSVDTTVWHIGSVLSDHDLRGVAASLSTWVAVGEDGAIVVSNDRQHWTGQLSGTEADLRGVTWNGRAFTAVGTRAVGDDGSEAVVLASWDGLHWTHFGTDGAGLTRVAPAGDGFVAVGQDRTIVRAECLGSLAGLEPSFLPLSLDGDGELMLVLEEPAVENIVVALSSSDPAAVEVPASVTVPQFDDSVEIPFELHAVGEVWVSATLPAGLGGGTTRALVSVQPPLWGPRRPAGRRTP